MTPLSERLGKKWHPWESGKVKTTTNPEKSLRKAGVPLYLKHHTEFHKLEGAGVLSRGFPASRRLAIAEGNEKSARQQKILKGNLRSSLCELKLMHYTSCTNEIKHIWFQFYICTLECFYLTLRLSFPLTALYCQSAWRPTSFYTAVKKSDLFLLVISYISYNLFLFSSWLKLCLLVWWVWTVHVTVWCLII